MKKFIKKIIAKFRKKIMKKIMKKIIKKFIEKLMKKFKNVEYFIIRKNKIGCANIVIDFQRGFRLEAH